MSDAISDIREHLSDMRIAHAARELLNLCEPKDDWSVALRLPDTPDAVNALARLETAIRNATPMSEHDRLVPIRARSRA